MKTLNDSLREEFSKILKNEEILMKINNNNLEMEVLNKAFEVLLKFKSNPDLKDKARTEFENYLINYIKSNNK